MLHQQGQCLMSKYKLSEKMLNAHLGIDLLLPYKLKFSKNLILVLLARYLSWLKLCTANDIFCLIIMCFIIWYHFLKLLKLSVVKTRY